MLVEPPVAPHMVDRVRAFDWAATSLGPMEDWPPALRAVTDLVLASPMVATLACGPERLLIYNDAAARLYGDRHPGALGRPLAETFDSFPDVAALYDQVFAGDALEVSAQPLTVGTHNGAAEVFDACLTPVRDADGKVIAVHMTGFEISEYVRAEAALRENEAIRRAALGAGRMGSWRWDLANRQVTGDAQFLSIWGFPPSDEPLPLAAFTDRMSPESAADTEVVVTKAIEAGEEFDAPVRIASGPTDGRWVRWRGRPADGDTSVLYGVSFDITEQKLAEERLRASEERLRGVLDSMAEGFALLDPDFNILDVNDQTVRLDGRTRGELVGQSHWDAFPGSETSPVGDAFRRVARDRVALTLEHEHSWPDDRSMWIDMRAYPSLGGGIAIFWHDITAQKQAEATLRDSEARLQKLAETASDVLFVADAAWQQLRPLEPGSSQVAQGPAIDWLGKFIPQSEQAAVRAAIRQAKRSRTPFELEHRVIHLDGSPGWAMTRAVPILDEKGNVTEWFGAASDITARRQAERALRDSERQLQTLVRGVPQLVWRAVDRGHWTWASPQWTAFTGQAEAASHERGWLHPVHPDDRAIVEAVWQDAVERGEFHADYRLYEAASGRYKWFQTRATPVRDAEGQIVEWLGTSTDVEDLRELQDRQELLVAELQHRVRNVLTIVRSVFALTVEAGGDVEAVADHFRGRLDALARTQVIVTQSATGLVDLENLIRDELLSVGHGDGPNLMIDGPEVRLPPKEAESIGLAIHELTINAIKYGALKHADAKLNISWKVNPSYGEKRLLILKWVETGVPAVSLRPARSGFGRELIEQALPYRLKARTELEFRGGGVCCTIDVPLPDVRDGAAPREATL